MMALFCFGLGYSARVLGRRLLAKDWAVSGTSTSAEGAAGLASDGFEGIVFDGDHAGNMADALAGATHILVSIPPGREVDPVLAHHADDLRRASPQWIGYFSTIGVYGDRGGAWIDETAEPRPTSDRSQRRLDAEQAWLELGAAIGARTVIFRLPGIYGPGRSAIDDLRRGTARRIVKPGQVFNRIHVGDIANAVEAAMSGRGTQAIYNVSDDEPAPAQDVVTYAAQLLGIEPPPEIPIEQANLSEMGRSFYAECKRVRNDRLRSDLGVTLVYPTYREGLAAILAAEPP